jgi:hypothetical protein
MDEDASRESSATEGDCSSTAFDFILKQLRHGVELSAAQKQTSKKFCCAYDVIVDKHSQLRSAFPDKLLENSALSDLRLLWAISETTRTTFSEAQVGII